MSRSAVNYKYINKYGTASSSNSRSNNSSYYDVTCVRLFVRWLGLLCVAALEREQ